MNLEQVVLPPRPCPARDQGVHHSGDYGVHR
jgi:hypothetical protein